MRPSTLQDAPYFFLQTLCLVNALFIGHIESTDQFHRYVRSSVSLSLLIRITHSFTFWNQLVSVVFSVLALFLYQFYGVLHFFFPAISFFVGIFSFIIFSYLDTMAWCLDLYVTIKELIPEPVKPYAQVKYYEYVAYLVPQTIVVIFLVYGSFQMWFLASDGIRDTDYIFQKFGIRIDPKARAYSKTERL